MKPTIKLIYLISLIVINTVMYHAQTVKPKVNLSRSLNEVNSKNTFASLECRFSIGLPELVNRVRNSCETFQWNLKEGFFYVGYKDKEQNVEESNAFENDLLNTAKDALDSLTRYTVEIPINDVKSKTKPFSFEGHRGIELRTEMPNGLSITRVFAIKNRVCSLTLLTVGEQMKYKDKALETLDSFKFLSQKKIDEIVKERVEKATPKPFPQEPVAKKLKSDAEDEGLKGKVKLVVESRYEYNKNHEKILKGSSEIYYNEQGNRVKEITYRYDGFPYSITVYGYIDGNRVSTTGYIFYATQLGGVLSPPLTPPTGPPDKRYQTRYENRYDENGKLIEELTYRNDGSLGTRIGYKRNGNQLERTNYYISFNNEPKTSTGTYLINEDEYVVEGSLSLTSGVPAKRVYTYELDAKGNWIKQVESYVQEIDGVKKSEPVYETIHKITYY